MPIIESAYKAPFFLRNKHLSTVLPSLFRKVNGIEYVRERIPTPDDDFLDLDWVENGNNRAVIVLHGLEGSSERAYVKGLIKHFTTHGWDAVGWNARSCSGEMNRQLRLYQHADIEDIETTISYVIDKKKYAEIVLVGMSMGGTILLNYLSKSLKPIPEQVRVAVAISAPVEVGDSARMLEKPGNSFYLNRFIKKLKVRIIKKAEQYPNRIDTAGLEDVRTFYEFDTNYTAPMHGFKNANDFYQQASSKSSLEKIDRPTLLLIAQNDPFMPSSCYPYEEARLSKNLYLEAPKHGGHVGFPLKNSTGSWMETRALEFVENFI